LVVFGAAFVSGCLSVDAGNDGDHE
jgi:hypothetical protein